MVKLRPRLHHRRISWLSLLIFVSNNLESFRTLSPSQWERWWETRNQWHLAKSFQICCFTSPVVKRTQSRGCWPSHCWGTRPSPTNPDWSWYLNSLSRRVRKGASLCSRPGAQQDFGHIEWFPKMNLTLTIYLFFLSSTSIIASCHRTSLLLYMSQELVLVEDIQHYDPIFYLFSSWTLGKSPNVQQACFLLFRRWHLSWHWGLTDPLIFNYWGKRMGCS